METQRNYEVQSGGQFLFKVALYQRYRYKYYYSRTIPEHKSARTIDRKLVLLYDVTFNRAIRKKRKEKGIRNVIYIRYKNLFILLATEGNHSQFDRLHYDSFSDTPFKFMHYTIGTKQQKTNVQLSHKFYSILRKKAVKIALDDYTKVERFLREISPYSYRGINEQRWKLYRIINQKRKKSNLIRIKWDDVKEK
jgi:hypothetical protein